MAPTVQQSPYGSEWLLGFIAISVPGTPVNIMSLVDPTDVNEPDTANPPTAGREVPIQCNQIVVQAFKPGAAHGTQRNTGNIYLLKEGAAGFNRDDTGSISLTLEPGQTGVNGAPATKTMQYNPYEYFIDGDNAGDGAFVKLII